LVISIRLFYDQLNEWLEAYRESSSGSARRRAKRIRAVYEPADPIPGEIPDQEADQFLKTARDMFREAAEVTGAKILAS
jgi:hypothetical protein